MFEKERPFNPGGFHKYMRDLEKEKGKMDKRTAAELYSKEFKIPFDVALKQVEGYMNIRKYTGLKNENVDRWVHLF